MTKQIDIQDRFRFRAWYMPICEDDKPCYVYDVEQLYDGRTNKGFSDELGWASSFGTLLDSPEQFIVEQCTGLKDKNGKLIYEGDIVAKEFSDKPFSSKAKSKIKNCLVYWHERGEFSIKYNSDNYRCYSTPHDSFIGDCEVIGNIHENPDLLENKDE